MRVLSARVVRAVFYMVISRVYKSSYSHYCILFFLFPFCDMCPATHISEISSLGRFTAFGILLSNFLLVQFGYVLLDLVDHVLLYPFVFVASPNKHDCFRPS